MGRVFIEEAMDVTGINRTDLVAVCAYLKRSGQASSAADALRLLETGTIDKHIIEEQMINSFMVEKVDTPKVEEEEDSIE
jgi:hypothetical protein